MRYRYMSYNRGAADDVKRCFAVFRAVSRCFAAFQH